jgi:hypothetical protein
MAETASMTKNLSVTVALFAGLLGGLLTRYIAPSPAFAQNQASATKEIRAQSFTLVDAQNRTVGTFTTEPASGLLPAPPTPPPGAPPVPPPSTPPGRGLSGTRIVLRDSNGREIWSAGDTAQFRQLAER